MANDSGIGFSKLVSVGNKADVDELDVLKAFGEDPQTKVIAGYLESISDGNAFVSQAEAISSQKPILLMKPGGTLFILGIPEVDRVGFDIHALRRKEIRIQNIRRQNGCTQNALDLMAEGMVDASFMATHRFPLHRAQDALEMVSRYEDGVIKALITAGP